MNLASSPLFLDPDRLLPTDPGVRAIARTLYDSVRELPIVSPHGHVPASLLQEDRAFGDPTALLITPDHYVTRLLHASGVSLETLGVGAGPLSPEDARKAWRIFCDHWDVFRGTPVRYWLESELTEIFSVTDRPSAAAADRIYDQIAHRLAEPDFRPRALFERFDVEVLATTDDPSDDLAAHRRLTDDPTFSGRVVPTFRPDRYLDPSSPGWSAALQQLAVAADTDTDTFKGFLTALELRRVHFIEHGAVSTDHGHEDAHAIALSTEEAERIFSAAVEGTATDAEKVAFRRHMLLEMARMSCDDGLVMTIHPGALRGHHPGTAARFGPDTGHDIPVRTEFTRALRPLLERFGTHPNLHLVLFTLDETAWSRELAPLAGFYPSVYVGAPWWFLDAPDAIRRFRSAVTETIGFSRTSGFIDDTRAFCSIPARHDMARRLDCGYLAQLVGEHRLAEDEAFALASELVVDNPRRVFKL